MTNPPITFIPHDVAAAPARGRLAFADGLRGLAALWVVLFHLSEGHHIDTLKAQLPRLLVDVLFDMGHLGVAVFFVLSGFVMALTVDRAVVDGRYASRFVLRRLLRLTPPYWLAIAVVSAVLMLKSHATGQTSLAPDARTLMAHAVYAQDMLGIGELNFVFWTLCIEVQFYLGFALLMWLTDSVAGRSDRRQGVRTVAMVVIAILCLAWPTHLIEENPWRGGFLPLWYSYLAGVLAFRGWTHRGWPLKAAISYALALAAIGLEIHDGFATATTLTVGALLLSGLRDGMRRWLSSWPFQFVGLVSYSLYLLHNSVTGVSFRALSRAAPGAGVLGELAMAVIVTGACLLAAWLCYLSIERPSIRLSHSIRLHKTA